MNKFFSAMFLACMMIFGTALTPSSTEAATLEINNQIGKPLYVSVIFHNEGEGWVNKGWWQVPANSFKSLNFPKHAKSQIWVHMHNADRSWGNGKAWTVIGEGFRYVVGKEQCPQGPRRRQVIYNAYDINQYGTVRVVAK